MEGDRRLCQPHAMLHISIHTLRMEGDLYIICSIVSLPPFQSTPSAWRVTVFSCSRWCNHLISIHTLRMEGDPFERILGNAFAISIHTLRMEGDIQCWVEAGRTVDISIHTLRVEGDRCIGWLFHSCWHFNPHPPRGG